VDSGASNDRCGCGAPDKEENCRGPVSGLLRNEVANRWRSQVKRDLLAFIDDATGIDRLRKLVKFLRACMAQISSS